MALATFGDYQLLHVIGTSGSGVTFRARRHGELCVVQIGDPVRAASPTFRDRWETRVEAALDRSVPGLAEVTGAGWRGDLPWVASAGEGWTLGEIVRTCAATETTLEKSLVVQAGLEVARALERLHQNVAPMLHGRVSPDQVLIQEDGTALLLGLGFSEVDLLRGWPLPDDPEALASIAPELLRQTNISGRIDVYGVALTLLSACAGTNPLASDSIDETREAVLAGAAFDPADPDLGAGLGAVLHVSLQTDPMQRPERPADLAARLDRVLRGLGGAPDPMDWTMLMDELFPDGPEGYRTEPGLMGRPTTRRVLTTILAPTARATPTRTPEAPRATPRTPPPEDRVVASWGASTEPQPTPEPPRPPAPAPFAQRLAAAAGSMAKPATRPVDPAATTEPPAPSPAAPPRAVPPPTSSALHSRAFARRPSNALIDPLAPLSMDAIRAPREGPPAPDAPPLPPEAPPIPNDDGPVALDVDFIQDVGPESVEAPRPVLPAPPKTMSRPAWETALEATPRARVAEADTTAVEDPVPVITAPSAPMTSGSRPADDDTGSRVVLPVLTVDDPPIAASPPPAPPRPVAVARPAVPPAPIPPRPMVEPRPVAESKAVAEARPTAAPPVVAAPPVEAAQPVIVPPAPLVIDPTPVVPAPVAAPLPRMPAPSAMVPPSANAEEPTEIPSTFYDVSGAGVLEPEAALPESAPPEATPPARTAPPVAPPTAAGPRIPWIFLGGMAILVGVLAGVWIGLSEAPTPTAETPSDVAKPEAAVAAPDAPVPPSSLESLVAEKEGEAILIRGVVSPDASIVTDAVTGGQSGRRARHLLRIPGGVSKVGHKRVALESKLATAYIIQRDGNAVTVSVDVAPETVTTATFSTEGTTFTLALRPATAVAAPASGGPSTSEEASEP